MKCETAKWCWECRGKCAEFDALAKEAAQCEKDRDDNADKLRVSEDARAAVVLSLTGMTQNWQAEMKRADQAEAELAERPSAADIAGWTLTGTCAGTLGVAAVRWGVEGTIDLWLVGVGAAQCVGALVAFRAE